MKRILRAVEEIIVMARHLRMSIKKLPMQAFFDYLVHCFSVPESSSLNLRYGITGVPLYFGSLLYTFASVCVFLDSIISRF